MGSLDTALLLPERLKKHRLGIAASDCCIGILSALECVGKSASMLRWL
ncbi:hypothetical protein OH492_14395 [Vibrio chagasii]|nr:hypothetical protein [Vibrio chagasii]